MKTQQTHVLELQVLKIMDLNIYKIKKIVLLLQRKKELYWLIVYKKILKTFKKLINLKKKK
jgi:hypothetical protein